LRVTPAPILRGLAMTESDEIDAAVGDDGISEGRFQLNSKYFSYYRWKWGEFDPRDPWDAARITDCLFQANYHELFDVMNIVDPSQWDDLRMTLAITAHRQGVAGVRKDGPSMWYVNKVRAFAREGNS
jgi:hypothetical protein